MPAIIRSRWYTYIGGNLTSPSSYLYSSVPPTCTSGPALCSIYAVYAGTTPAGITDNLKRYISGGLSTSVPQPAFPVGAKKFVYMKTNA